MAIWTTLALLCTVSSVAVAATLNATKHSSICESTPNSTNKIQCYCTSDPRDVIRSADCYITIENLGPEDKSWEDFNVLKNARKLTLTNSRGITLKYIPTKALKQTKELLKLDVKYSLIHRIEPYAFANLTSLLEFALRDNQIEVLEKNAFAHHSGLSTIGLDKNNIVEINRDVFVDLPSLQKLFLTSNKITTLHDRVFVHLVNLKELEIDRNRIFSLNSETFSGLKNLEKLDLSSNSLEVIGDNTFLPLTNLRSLNLESNNIQMLDDKAFNGLGNLQSLSLARNKLSSIDNVKIFEGLDALISLSFKENELRELKPELMAPILNNFYGISSSFDVEGNNFSCACHLDWFMSLMNKTQNNHLKLSIENLKCTPEPEIRDIYARTVEADKSSVFDEEEQQAQNTDYEYYDEGQLNGKLFYIDMRYLLNCTNPSLPAIPNIKPATTDVKGAKDLIAEDAKEIGPTVKTEFKLKSATNAVSLDLGNMETTTKVIAVARNKLDRNEVQADVNAYRYTTSRLATVSAKPLDDRKPYDEREMAADEAKPDRLEAHKNVHDDMQPIHYKTNSAKGNFGYGAVLASIFIFRLLF